jgi:hypothetical protein
MKRESRYAVLARHAIFCAASAFHNFLSEKSVTLHGVVVTLASAHLILTEANHLYFRV